MSAEINYKNKYLSLRSKYMEDVDMAFRLGFEAGQQAQQQDQMMQEQQQAQELQAAAAGGAGGFGQEGQGAPGEQPGAPGGEQPPSEHPEGSELDQHIAKLESMIAKSESDPKELQKCVEDFRKLQKSWKDASDLRKSAEAIKGIAKALHKPAFKMSKGAQINLNSNAKQAVSMQHKIVNDVMQKMEEEEQRAKQDIPAILASLKE